MQKEKVTLEVQSDMLRKEKLSELDTIVQKLEAEVRKPYRTPSERKDKVVEWSSQMTGYEILLIEQAVLLLQNLILKHIRQQVNRKKGNNEDQET